MLVDLFVLPRHLSCICTSLVAESFIPFLVNVALLYPSASQESYRVSKTYICNSSVTSLVGPVSTLLIRFKTVTQCKVITIRSVSSVDVRMFSYRAEDLLL